MKLQVFAVRDRAIGAFMQPWFAPSVGAAIRAFTDSVNDATSPWNKHPDDYDLWHLGEWDDQNGRFEVSESGVLAGAVAQIALGKQVVIKVN